MIPGITLQYNAPLKYFYEGQAGLQKRTFYTNVFTKYLMKYL
jgi:hypothetical protein